MQIIWKRIEDIDLRLALAKAPNLKSVLLKGSYFHFKEPSSNENARGLDRLLDSLKNCPKLEHVLIRDYDSEELNLSFPNLANLIKQNKSIKKLTFWHQKIDGTNFAVLCNQLVKTEVKINLDLNYNVTLSPENDILLKKTLQANTLIELTGTYTVSSSKAREQQPTNQLTVILALV